MTNIDFQEVKKHIAIENVAYHLNLEITEKRSNELKAICPFCGYNKLSKVSTLSLNILSNKYCCSRCGAGGYSIGLYAKLKCIDNKKAYRELLDRECFDLNKSKIEISPINEMADIDTRDKVYRDFLSMLKLNPIHKSYLRSLGFLETTIDEQLYKTIPKSPILRRLIASKLKNKYNLAGIPGFYQHEDWGWTFSGARGFLIPIINENDKIEALSIHLDEPFNDTSDIWFSSSDKINGTGIKNIVYKSNIDEETTSVILTDNLLLNNYIKETKGYPTISFSQITNVYQILKVIDNTKINKIKFLFNLKSCDRIDYIIDRVFKNLLPLGYILYLDYIENFEDTLKEDIICFDTRSQLVA